MRTPAGTECPHYYADFHRGRSIQECRLLARSDDSLRWEPRVCATCPVPAILRANGCPHMTLRARLTRRWLRRRVEVEAFCTQYKVAVEDPYVGCGRCHPDAATVLAVGEEENDSGAPA
ncbi:MAG TPA: hypothetical protein ENI37_00155 [Chloroflexi bacterium]|nr:hypothetical protein [Chloroflexota bacterium]